MVSYWYYVAMLHFIATVNWLPLAQKSIYRLRTNSVVIYLC